MDKNQIQKAADQIAKIINDRICDNLLIEDVGNTYRELSDVEVCKQALGLIKLFEGVSLIDFDRILNQAKTIARQGTVINTATEFYKDMEVKAYPVLFGPNSLTPDSKL